MRGTTEPNIKDLLLQLTNKVEYLTQKIEDLETPKPQPKLIPLKEGSKLLGLTYPNALAKIKSMPPLFRPGIEAFDQSLPDSVNSSWYLDVEACIDRIKVEGHRRT